MLFPVYLKAAIFLQTRFGEEQRPFYTRGPRLSGFGTFAQNFEMGIGMFKG